MSGVNPNSMNSKLEADYVEFVNGQLDSIPIHDIEDFQTIASALEAINESTQSNNLPENLKESIGAITELIKEPELYAAPENQEGFKEIVMKRIAAKVKEIQNLTTEEKIKQLHSSIDKRIMADDYKERVANLAPPSPGSDAHVLSFEDYLREVNRQLDNEEFQSVDIGFTISINNSSTDYPPGSSIGYGSTTGDYTDSDIIIPNDWS